MYTNISTEGQLIMAAILYSKALMYYKIDLYHLFQFTGISSRGIFVGFKIQMRGKIPL